MKSGNDRNVAHSTIAAAARATRWDGRTSSSRLPQVQRGRSVATAQGLLSLALASSAGAAACPQPLSPRPRRRVSRRSPRTERLRRCPVELRFGQGPHTGPCYERPGPGEAIGWLPADLPLPDGTYPITELQDDGRFRRAVLAVPLTYGDFVQFVLARWPADGWISGAANRSWAKPRTVRARRHVRRLRARRVLRGRLERDPPRPQRHPAERYRRDGLDRMTRRLVGTLVLSAVIWLIAPCDGGEDGRSRDEFVDEGDRLCASYNETSGRLIAQIVDEERRGGRGLAGGKWTCAEGDG